MKYIVPEAEHGRVNNLKDTCFKYNGWPSVCRDDRGVLYAVASSMRMAHVDPTGKNCMYISFNEGKTWTPPIVVNDSYADDRDMGIVYLGNGKMVISWFTEAPEDYMEPIQSYDWFPAPDKAIAGGFTNAWKALPEDVYKSCNAAFVKVSEDYGVTWTDPIRVPVTAPHGPSLCADGTLVYMGKEMNPDYLAPNPILVYSSHDGGYNWEYTGTVQPGEGCTNENMHEPHVIELPNGRLLGAIRVHGLIGDSTECAETVYTTFSDDKGKTWSDPVPTGVEGLPPHLMVHSSGAVILSYGCRVNGKRAERALVSYDNGETWTEDYMLNDKLDFFCDMGYPCTVELSDGGLMTVYYQKWPGDWWTSVLYTKWRLGDNTENN